MVTKLELALERFMNSKGKSVPYHLDFNDFILECYLGYPPSAYGKYLEKKIIQEVGRLLSIPESENRGDCEIRVNASRGSLLMDDGSVYVYTHNHKSNFYRTKNFEIKITFLGKNNHYVLRNLRPYQNIDGGYIICLIDCENNFVPEFYLVDFDVIQQYMTLSHMNGSKSIHQDSNFENFGCSFEKFSVQHYLLSVNNKLQGNSLEDLKTYIDELWRLEADSLLDSIK
jgi:hypothetical protein